MLNELRTLERGLAEIGVAAAARHPDVSRLLKSDVIRVRLDDAGAIGAIEVVAKSAGREVWTLRDGKQNGFPGMKTSAGLLDPDPATRDDHAARWAAARSPAAKRAELQRLVQAAPPRDLARRWPGPGHRARIDHRLASLRVLADDPASAAVPAAFDRFLRALRRKPGFVADLLQGLVREIDDGQDQDLDAIRRALLEPFALAIDVWRPVAIGRAEQFTRDAGDSRQIEAVSRALGGERSGANDLSDCALSGASSRPLEGAFPQPTLPGLGQTYLFSRNKDIPALARYGRTGPGSFPVDGQLVARFSGTLAAITNPDNRGISWRLLPGDARGDRDLFIAFVASSPNERLVDALASDEDIAASAIVDEMTSEHVDFWDGIASRAAPGEVAHFLILRSVDPGNRKAIYHNRPSVRALHAAARLWTEAMANTPAGIEWPIFVGRKRVPGRPRPQVPLSLVGQSRKIYVRGGREAVEAPGLSGAETLALYLGEGDRPARARRMLRLLLDRQTGLLTGIAHANRRDQLADFDKRGRARVDALKGAAWLGALLFFLDCRKENYMQDASFRLGQLLAAADAIHMGYCADRRAGDVPPALLGNSVFAMAGRSPTRALSTLQQRMGPYLAWARRDGEARDRAARLFGEAEAEEASAATRGEAKPRTLKMAGGRIHAGLDVARRWTELAGSLAAQFHDIAPGDEFRAKLLLGYIAGIPRPAKDAAGGAPPAPQDQAREIDA